MVEQMLAHEATMRLTIFGVIFLVIAFCECTLPRRVQRTPRLLRWPGNLGVMLIDAFVLRFAFPMLAVGIAVMGEQREWGILNQFAISSWISILLTIGFLDLAIYAQHRLFHHVPFLWRMHRVHHADLEFDVTTGVRFHPLEMVISMCIKILLVVLLGAPAIAVLVFEIVLSGTALFNHGNVQIPARVERVLRWCIVTPDMHRVHHSIIPIETNSNFGFNLPWWDRLFGTYTAEPNSGHQQMTLGIDQFRTRKDLRLDQMLIQPLRQARPHSAKN